MDKSFWRSIVEADYAIPAGYTVEQLTPGLIGALGSTDGMLRDEYAYMILGNWIERGHYGPDELRALLVQLADGLAYGLGERDTDSVFRRSFSILVANEVLGYDNARAFLGEQEVHAWLDRVIAYLLAEHDLRGYAEGKGWAHAVAHAADTFRVLARSRYMGMREQERMLAAIADRVLAHVDHVYLYDEDERLAFAVMTILRRDMLELPFLSAWLDRLARPIGERAWAEAAANPALLSAYQNAETFLRSLYFPLYFGDRAPAFQLDDPYFAHVPALRDELLLRLEAAIRALGRGFYPQPR